MAIGETLSLRRALMGFLIAGAFAVSVYAQPTVTITGPDPINCPTTAGKYRVCATATPSGGTITKVVFYRNDVPYETVTSFPYRMAEAVLGQDTYVFRARAYDSNNLWTDSSEINYVVNTPQVLVMDGTTTINGVLLKSAGPNKDHSDGIQAALDYLSSANGGTLFFPCKLPTGQQQAVYTISKTIKVPANVTLQGEGSERWAKCRIYWYNWNESFTVPNGEQANCYNAPASLKDRPMFQLIGGSSRVRFRDLGLYSRSSGNDCYERGDYNEIRIDENTGIEMNSSVDAACFSNQANCGQQNGGDISDVIFENVSINDFTYGIKAFGKTSQSFGIAGIKVRGYRANTNHRQLLINSPFAYDWDVQNLNISAMTAIQRGAFPGQGGVQIERSGHPAGYTGLNPGLKFLHLNCNGTKPYRPAFCVQVVKHGGLYFRQLHHEGAERALDVVKLTSETNPDPIIMESSVATGRFEDPSMQLYLIGNAILAPDAIAPGLDDARLRFIDDGKSSTVLDCGDVHWDWTDAAGTNVPVQWGDLWMLLSHTERNRASFYGNDQGYKYIKGHKYCLTGDSVLPDANKIGGLYFDNGTLPTETGTYSWTINAASMPASCATKTVAECIEYHLDYQAAPPTHGGSVYIIGNLTVDRSVNIPRGAQLIGAPNSQITLNSSSPTSLLKLTIPVSGTDPFGQSGTVIRNLKLYTASNVHTGLELVNESTNNVGVSRDLHFSNLTFEGFDIGLHAHASAAYPLQEPMIDGISLKRMTFLGNNTAAKIDSNNASNWNVMNVSIEAAINKTGWYQIESGLQDLQHVTCKGTSSTKRMADCIKLKMARLFYLSDLRRPQNTINALSTEDNIEGAGDIYYARTPSDMVLRDSDFSSESAFSSPNNISLVGKSFITSMNNKYTNFSITSSIYEGEKSRVTFCGDSYPGTTHYLGLDPVYKNLWVGIDTPTRVECAPRAIPWEDPVSLGGVFVSSNSPENDKPLAGNFFTSVQQDLVIFRPKTASSNLSQFLIKSQDGVQHKEVQFGDYGDIPLTAHFSAGQNSQIVTFKPSTGDWKWVDPMVTPLPTPTTFHWGANGDIPLVGNFFDDTDNLDDIAVYRPTGNQFWIYNRQTGTWAVYTSNHGSDIKVGDFLGLGFDQIAQFVASSGDWYILRADTGASTTRSLGTTGDVAVPGHYLPKPAPTGYQDCTQLGVWRPADQKFYIKDADPVCGLRTETSYFMSWGSNNDLDSSHTAENDIPLAVKNAGGIARPASYRPNAGVFPKSVAAGQWWIHDPFVP